MNILNIITTTSLWIIVLFSAVPKLKRIDHRGFISYTFLAVLGITTSVEMRWDFDPMLWFCYVMIAWTIFLNTTTYGKQYQQKVQLILGKWIYLIHAAIIVLMIYLDLTIHLLSFFSVIVIMAILLFDLKKYQREHEKI